MPGDVSTTLHTALSRAMGSLMDRIAVDGLSALKKTLDEAGVPERLKQYEIYSHVAGDSILFEIVVDSSRVIATDRKTMEAIRSEMSNMREQMMKRVMKSFEIGPEGPRRVVRDARIAQNDVRMRPMDARRGARDARRQILDARRKLEDKRIEGIHGMDLTPDGKLSVTIERSASAGKLGFKYPKGAFQGIMGDFINRLQDAISNNFSEKLESILSKHL
jgi:hypothetical protein